MDANHIPKALISYCWTSIEHREWVRELADRLRGDGVDVSLDVYELKEGQDKYAYIERMVTDSDISKVLVISDRRYAEKADTREGGVGTESIIISQEVYEKVEQKKFIPVVTGFDQQGAPYLPTFMKGRMYIDLSSEEKLAENYEVLLRSIFDKPLYEKPALGRPPSFLFEEGLAATKTGFKLQMLKDAVLKNKPTVKGLTVDYLRSFESGFAGFRFTDKDYEGAFGDKVRSNIRRFLPYRNEFIDFILFVGLYVEDEQVYQEIFNSFERLLAYQNPPAGMAGFDSLTDNFRFILYELFLYLMAALIKTQRFGIANIFLTQEYFSPGQNSRYDNYAVFSYVEAVTFEFDSSGMNTGGWTKLLQERSSNEELTFDKLKEADLVLFLRSLLHRTGDFEMFWIPKTHFRAYYASTFELFARAESLRHFEALKTLLRVESKEDLVEKMDAAVARPGFGAVGLRAETLKAMMNLDQLGTRP